MAWHAINGHTGRHQDAYILQIVGPALEAAARQWPSYFIRHWQGGPHVSLRIAAPLGEFRRFAETFGDRARRWLAGRGAEDSAADEGLLRRLSVLEGHDQVAPAQPPGTVVAVEHLPRRTRELGGETAARLFESFLADANGHALTGIDLAVRLGRLAVAFDALATGPDGLIGDIRRFFMCYRSHADGFLMSAPDPDRTRDFFERSYQQRRGELRARLEALLDGIDDSLARWARAATPRLRRFRDQVDDALSSGELRPVTLDLPDSEGPVAPSPEDIEARLAHSAFHQALWSTGYYRALIEKPEWQSFRLVVNYQYAQLARVGVTGFERFLACHLVARAVEEKFDVDAAAVVRHAATRGP